MKKLSKTRILNLAIRIGLFSLILMLGTFTALVAGEEPGLALADLSEAPVQTMAAGDHNATLYAAMTSGSTDNSLYRSKDNGRTWQAVGTWPDETINSLATNPTNASVLYAGTPGGPLGSTNNVWRSVDGGQTWQNFNLSLPAGPDRIVPAVTAVVADPNQPGVLYVGTDGQGVYRFEDGTIGYQLVGGLSLPDAHVKNLVAGPDSWLYSLTNRGLFVTTGETWQALDSVPEVPISLAVASSDSNILYAGGPSGGVYRSGDGGQTWLNINEGLDFAPGVSLRATAIAVDEADPMHVVVSTAYGLGSEIAPGAIYESTTAGRMWTKVADVGNLVKALTLNDNIILAATDKGLLHFGAPVQVSTGVTPSNLQSLSNPTGMQALVLVLTLVLAALVLIGRIEWLTRATD